MNKIYKITLPNGEEQVTTSEIFNVDPYGRLGFYNIGNDEKWICVDMYNVDQWIRVQEITE